jgi:hypothetical protein
MSPPHNKYPNLKNKEKGEMSNVLSHKINASQHDPEILITPVGVAVIKITPQTP